MRSSSIPSGSTITRWALPSQAVLVYRGKQLPELYGCYVYGDFVSGRMWALRYDTAQRRVVEHLEIPGPALPIMSFGEDEQGELYMAVNDGNGNGIYRFVESK